MAAFPLQSLLEHARHRMDAGERLLLMVKRKEDAARQRLDELESFRREYQERLSGSVRNGMTIQLLRDYHVFLGKLGNAIKHQRGEVEQLHARWEAAHETWLELRQKAKSYEVLAERHHVSEARRLERSEQGQSDELTGRKAAASRLAERG